MMPPMKEKEEIGKRFVERTKYHGAGSSDQQKGLPQPPLEEPWDHGGETIDMPRREDLLFDKVSLAEAIQKRESVRQYGPAPLSLEELCFLLMCTAGVKRVVPGVATFRAAPSAGARHALETYVLANRVEGLAPGLYRFLAIERKILKVSGPDNPAIAAGSFQGGPMGLLEQFTEACLGQAFVHASAALFLWVADAYRMTYRYGQRGYRYLYLDAGHVCQNLYLAAEEIGAGVCAIGAFDDDRVDELLGLKGKDQFAIYLAAVGKKVPA
jgi:SagB-type dehydrogenase family enzyme